ILRANQVELFPPDPSFDLRFALDRFIDPIELFNVYQPRHLVSLCEARGRTRLVFVEPPLDVVCNSGIQNAIFAAQDVYEKAPSLSHGSGSRFFDVESAATTAPDSLERRSRAGRARRATGGNCPPARSSRRCRCNNLSTARPVGAAGRTRP